MILASFYFPSCVSVRMLESQFVVEVRWIGGGTIVYVLGLLFLTDVHLLGGRLALGEGIAELQLAVDSVCLYCPVLNATHPPAEPVGLEVAEPVAPSVMRRAATEK